MEIRVAISLTASGYLLQDMVLVHVSDRCPVKNRFCQSIFNPDPVALFTKIYLRPSFQFFRFLQFL